MGDLKTYGFLFETMAVRDLRVYMDALDGAVAHYLDASGLECDAVLRERFAVLEVGLRSGRGEIGKTEVCYQWFRNGDVFFEIRPDEGDGGLRGSRAPILPRWPPKCLAAGA